jgi:hypothetical protein
VSIWTFRHEAGVGAEVTCNARHGKERGEGKAQLETDKLLFRGAFRLSIPLAGAKARAEGDLLVVTWDGGEASFELGEKRAATWAQKIAHPPTRVDKAGVKPGMRVLLLGVTDKALAKEVRDAGAAVTKIDGADVVFWQVDEPADLADVALHAKALGKEAALWIVTPRGVPALADTVVMMAAKKAGLVDTKVMRFNETHTALKWVWPKKKR